MCKWIFLLPISCNFMTKYWCGGGGVGVKADYLRQSLGQRIKLQLFKKCSMDVYCPLPCEQKIPEQKCVLLMCQQETNAKHGYFCMDNNERHCVKFYLPCSQACLKIGEFPVHSKFVHTLLFFPLMSWALL